ncbi:MAG: linear amide C-N hydrolase [Muribaculaceae bacterium]|nr:linear amide C-N hydrolase [Muribaculaceae bacterium]
MKRFFLAVAAVLTTMAGIYQADACTRVLYVGDSALRIVGRSLDWRTPIPTNLYVYPRGMKKVGNLSSNSVTWTSKYGAVYAVGYDGGVTEGMNEKGLVINGLFCKGTKYTNVYTEGRPAMSLSVFVAWLLDMNATTDDVVAVLKQHNFNISGATFDGGTVSALHWGITDATGKSAILEFDNGEINVYEGQDIAALTNDPAWPKMNAINDYWKSIGGQNMLPGTVKSPDRFVRANYFAQHVKKTADSSLGAAICRSIVMNCSVPFQYAVEGEPNLSSTQWRSLANLRDRTYYFDIVTNPGMFYIDLKKCDLRPGAPVLKLDTSKSDNFVGDVTAKLTPSAPFTPMY